MNKISIRKAMKEDMANVMELIKELAAFENMENQVMINEKILEKDGFDHELFSCFVAEVDNKIVGYALYHFPYSTWVGKMIFLEDIYVKQIYRNCGIGTALFRAVAKEAYNNKTRLQFNVLSWNPAKNFYEKFGAINLTESENWHMYRLDYEAQKCMFEGQ